MAADDSTDEQTSGRGQPGGGRAVDRRVVGRRSPRIPAPLAAAAVGVLVAVLARVLILAGEVGCEALRGTSSCGGAGGFMLMLIAVLMLYAGTRLLRTLVVPDPGVTSALGLALLGIAMLTVLLDSIFSPWMWVVLPLVAAALYAFAAWAAATLSEMGSS
ncbi:MAG: hypothetical protein M3211_04175 [Actinomycetota bacterium]|nr:hypothetical protein [Actinomycetota bacterium]